MTPCLGLNIGLLTICRINNFLTASHLSENCDLESWFVSVCGDCYGGYLPTPYPYPVPYYTGCCGCGAPCPQCVPVNPCQACAMMTMTTPYQPRPPRPNTLPGIQSLHTYGVRGRHDSPILPEKQVVVVSPLNTPVHMHPDPGSLGQPGHTDNNTGFVLFL